MLITGAASISAMTALTASAGDIAIVTDQQGAGMTFVFSTSGTPDGGIVFAGVNGVWTRQYNPPDVYAAWWGVKGDFNPVAKTGTDDTAAIQLAIDKAAKIGTASDESGQGATLHFAPGFYLISDTITFRGGGGNGRSHIQGAGSASTTFYLADASDCDIFKCEPTSPTPTPTHHHSTLSDFRVFGNRDNQTGSYVGLNCYGSGSGFVVEDVKMDDIAGTAFYVESASYVTFRNIHATRCDKHCMEIDGASCQNISIDGIEMGEANVSQFYVHDTTGGGGSQFTFRNFRIDAYTTKPTAGFVVLNDMNSTPLFIDGFHFQIASTAATGTTNAITLGGSTIPRLSLRNIGYRSGDVDNIVQDNVNSITIPVTSSNPLFNYNLAQNGFSLSFTSDPVFAARFKGETQNGIEIGGRRINFGSGSAVTDLSLTRDDPNQLRVIAKSNGASKNFKANRFLAEKDIRFDVGGVQIIPGNGSPEGVVSAPPGSLYLRADGGAGSSHYVKESGTGSTGWAAK